MPFAVRIAAALALLALPVLPATAQSDEPHSLGACGGVMTGYDGRQFVCEPDRRPACQPDGSRCVCVERRECGGRHDEPF